MYLPEPRNFSSANGLVKNQLGDGLGVNVLSNIVYSTLGGGMQDYQQSRDLQLRQNTNWIFVANDRIAKDMARIEYSLYNKDTPLDNHFLYGMCDKPNSAMSWSELLYLAEYSRGWLGNAFIYMPKNTRGLPAQMMFLYPEFGYMSVKKTSQNEITGYVLQSAGRLIHFEADEIIHLKYPTINSATYGRSPGMAFTEVIELDQKIKEFANALIENGSFPSIFLKTETNLTAEQRKSLKEQWSETQAGYKKVGKFVALSKGEDLQTVNYNTKDLEFLESQKNNKEQIFQAYGIPLLDQSVNRSVAETGLYVYYRGTIAPRLAMLEDDLNRGFVHKYDEGIDLKFENCVPEDEETQARVRKILIDSGQMTPDEARREENMLPHPNGIGSVPIINGNINTLASIIAGKQSQGQVQDITQGQP
jgi:HK97 family phage portal protein